MSAALLCAAMGVSSLTGFARPTAAQTSLEAKQVAAEKALSCVTDAATIARLSNHDAHDLPSHAALATRAREAGWVPDVQAAVSAGRADAAWTRRALGDADRVDDRNQYDVRARLSVTWSPRRALFAPAEAGLLRGAEQRVERALHRRQIMAKHVQRLATLLHAGPAEAPADTTARLSRFYATWRALDVVLGGALRTTCGL